MTFRGFPFLPSGVTVAVVAGLVAILMPLGAASAPPRYTVERLGTLGGPYSFARAINNRGDVAGYSQFDSTPRSHGFVHANGAMIDIGVVGYDSCSQASDVNDNGQVVGFSDFACESNRRPSLYADGAHIYLLDYLAFGMAMSINTSGQITGFLSTALGQRAFFLSAGSVTYLGTLGGSYSYGRGLNDRGDIVGESATMPPSPDVTTESPHAFLYASGTIHDLGTLGGSSSSANAINNAGHVTGRAATFGDTAIHAFVYANGVM